MDATAELAALSVRELLDWLGNIEDAIRAQRRRPDTPDAAGREGAEDEVVDLVRAEQRIVHELRRRRSHNRPLFAWYHNHRPVAPAGPVGDI